jgi:hypothetical protein
VPFVLVERDTQKYETKEIVKTPIFAEPIGLRVGQPT